MVMLVVVLLITIFAVSKHGFAPVTKLQTIDEASGAVLLASAAPWVVELETISIVSVGGPPGLLRASGVLIVVVVEARAWPLGLSVGLHLPLLGLQVLHLSLQALDSGEEVGLTASGGGPKSALTPLQPKR